MAPLMEPVPLPCRPALRVRPGEALLLEAGWMGAEGEEEAPMLLARVDVLGGDGGGGGEGAAAEEAPLEARLYCPPSVRARVVPAAEAPRHSAVPASHVAAVRAELASQGNAADAAALDAAVIRRPLAAEVDATLVGSTRRAYAPAGRLHAVDVAFACLGWVNVARPTPFRVRALPVEGAAAYAREPFYEDVEYVE